VQGLDALGVTYDQPGAYGQPATKGNIWDYAEQAGVNKDDFYKEVTGLYGAKQTVFDNVAFKNAVSDKYQHVYRAVGLVEGGPHSAFSQDIVDKAKAAGADHALVYFTKVGDKLIPMQEPQLFKAQREGGGFGEFVAQVAPYVLMFVPGAQGLAMKLGTAVVGSAGTAAAMVGNAAMSAGFALATGGDVWKSAAMGGIGGGVGAGFGE